VISFSKSCRSAAVLVALSVGCAHQPAADTVARLDRQESGAPHLAAGCVAACQEATYVEVSPKGDLCRCWAPNAFQYTFAFPDTAEKLSYSRSRWSTGVRNVRRCVTEGRAWEPSANREAIVCLDPSTPPPASDRSVADHSATPSIPESVF
jgi:hypothetical protein